MDVRTINLFFKKFLIFRKIPKVDILYESYFKKINLYLNLKNLLKIKIKIY